MATRDDVLEALAHTWATRHRLASQPGTHRERARLTDRFDALRICLQGLVPVRFQLYGQVVPSPG